MFQTTKEEVLSKKLKNKQIFEHDIFQSLNNAKGWLQLILPKAVIVVKKEEKQVKLPLEQVITERNQIYQDWIQEIFEIAVNLTENYGEIKAPFESGIIPEQIAKRFIYSLLKILDCEGEIDDNGLYFISDVANAIGLDLTLVKTEVEKVKFESRHEFTNLIIENFSEKHCYWCALMLWKAIHVDGLIHPNEYIFFDNIFNLIGKDPTKLLRLQYDSEFKDFIFKPVNAELAKSIFKYIVEIVMCDGDFDPKESAFVQEVARAFGYDKHQQDEIIQPAVSSFMVQQSIFAS